MLIPSLFKFLPETWVLLPLAGGESEQVPECSCCLLELMLWNGKIDSERLYWKTIHFSPAFLFDTFNLQSDSLSAPCMAWLARSCPSCAPWSRVATQDRSAETEKTLTFQIPDSQRSCKANKTRCWKECDCYNCEGNLSRRKAILRNSETSTGVETIMMEIACTAELTCGAFIYTIVEYHESEIYFEGKAMSHHENKYNGLFYDLGRNSL